MAMSLSASKLTCLVPVLMLVLIGTAMTRAEVTCNQVVRNLTPCMSFVANGGSVPGECCTGVKTLYGAAQTTTDRQQVCRCIEQAINGIPYTSFNLDNAAKLPEQCGVELPYKIDPSTNCDNVK